MDFVALGHALSVWLAPVLLAITFHEAAHAWVADKLGDDTARVLGRVTFNPIKHVDPIGTVVLPGFLLIVGAPFLIGWAKPVPVAFHRLFNPKRDMALVALAGPGINIALALLASLLLRLFGLMGDGPLPPDIAAWLARNLENFLFVNIVLAVFNMFPLPPLDGGRVVTSLLPPPLDWKFGSIERYGLPILLMLLLVLPAALGAIGVPFDPLDLLFLPAIRATLDVVLFLTGWPV